jgi:hypothetical protein
MINDKALTAMPGDAILFEQEGISLWAKVKTAGWQPTPNGGKTWTYETADGILIDHTKVLDVEKMWKSPQVIVTALDKEQDQTGSSRYLMQEIESTALPTMLKAAVHCVLMDDEKNLEVAAFLINNRVKQLRELSIGG